MKAFQKLLYKDFQVLHSVSAELTLPLSVTSQQGLALLCMWGYIYTAITLLEPQISTYLDTLVCKRNAATDIKIARAKVRCCNAKHREGYVHASRRSIAGYVLLRAAVNKLYRRGFHTQQAICMRISIQSTWLSSNFDHCWTLPMIIWTPPLSGKNR